MTNKKFRADIEGLRAIAIIVVVLYHAGVPWAAGGYRGVDVFFVLSGFLITGLLVDEVETTGTVSLTQFWARRARRLLPAATVVTFVVLLLDAFFLTPFDQIAVAQSVRAFAAYTSNVFFAVRTTEYFGGGGAHQPMLHTWSLSVEEQFYLLFAPLLLGFAAWSAKGGPRVFRRRFAITIAALTAVSFAGWLVMLYRYPLVSFFILPTRIWELGLGALAVFVATPAFTTPRIRNEIVALVCMGILLASAAFTKTAIETFGLTRLFPTAVTAVLILSGVTGTPTLMARFLSTSPMRMIGRFSYGWYLWHWPALVFLDEVVPHPSLGLRVSVAVLMLIPAAITYRWVTSPIRFSPYLQRHARLAVAGAVAVAGVTVGLASMAIYRANRVLATPIYAPIVAGKVLPAVYDNGCHLSIAAVKTPACEFGPARNDTTIVLFGDSHAAQWFPALDSIATLRGWRLVSLTKSACPSIDVVVWNGQLGRQYDECSTWRTHMITRIVGLHPTLVVIANTRAYEVVDGERRLRTDRSTEARALWYVGVRRTLAALAGSNARLMVLQNNPHPAFDVPNCEAKYVDDPPQCDWFMMRPVDTVLAATERSAVGHYTNATYVSLNDALCDGPKCFAVHDGIVRYMDTNHISVPYAQALIPEVSQLLTQVLTDSAFTRPRALPAPPLASARATL